MSREGHESNRDLYDVIMHGTAPWGYRAPGKRRRIMIYALVAASALALTSCSGGGGSSQSTTPPSSNAIPASTLAQLQATISQAEAVPAFTPPGPKVNASILQGKQALVMPVNSQIDACNTQAQDFQALGQQLGMNVQMYTDQGVPTQWMAGIEQATQNHDQAIVLDCGIEPPLVSSQLQAAKAQGIAVVDGNFNETNNYAGLDGETAVNTAQGITDDVYQAILNQNGKALHALVVSSPSIIQGQAASAAATTAVQHTCPTVCSVVDVNVPIQVWPTETASAVQAALAAHPDINAVIIVFDGMVQFAYNTVATVALHRPGLEIYTWGASRTVEAYMLEHGSIIAANPGPDEQWDAYEAMDQVIRLLSGQPAASVNNEVDPDRFWVPANVAEFFGPGGTYGNGGYGNDTFINGFRQLWDLPPVSSSGS
jgi:ribose transport system substrate-binding protein